jgi:DNA-binding PadR family transcriptional regulator
MKLRRQEKIALKILSKQTAEIYGKDIVELSSGELGKWNIYVYLARLEDLELITGREESEVRIKGMLPRRLYKITDTGMSFLLAEV